ncbi:MAG: helix-turn-helix domain-containing protein [Myxococcota bacterium]|nr:helix-turn-helix domain-containing protein [Myxococcota bacterium]
MKAETFGVRLRRLRTQRGYTLAGLARLVLVTEAAIRNLETGDSKGPSFLVGVRLADALGVDVHYLAFGEGASLGGRVLELERRMTAFEQLHLEERRRRENP